MYALYSPEVEIQAITVVHGNTSLENTCRNLLQCLDMLSPHMTLDAPIPIAFGASQPLMDVRTTHAEHVHGEDGLPPFPSSFEDQRDSSSAAPTLYTLSHERTAAEEILYQLRRHPPHSLTLVFLGPLTNLAKAMLADSEHLSTLSRCASIVVMGGAVHQPTPGGNITPYAEFNFYADPLAASLVLQSGLPVVLVPLDVTETCRLGLSFFEEKLKPRLHRRFVLDAFLENCLQHLFVFMQSLVEDKQLQQKQQQQQNVLKMQEGKNCFSNENNNNVVLQSVEETLNTTPSLSTASIAMHDPLCLGVVIDPGILESVHAMYMDIETHPGAQTRAMCLVDGRPWKDPAEAKPMKGALYKSVQGLGPRPVDVVMKVDCDRFFAGFVQRVFQLEWDVRYAWQG